MKKFIPHVLLSDGDEFLLSIYKKKFEELEYKVSVARTAESVLKEVEKKHPNVIVLDPLISGGAGFETIAALQKSAKWCRIPIVVYTSLGEKKDIRRAMNFGVFAYLIKSHTEAGDLLEVVQEALESMRTK